MYANAIPGVAIGILGSAIGVFVYIFRACGYCKEKKKIVGYTRAQRYLPLCMLLVFYCLLMYAPCAPGAMAGWTVKRCSYL